METEERTEERMIDEAFDWLRKAHFSTSTNDKLECMERARRLLNQFCEKVGIDTKTKGL